MGIRRAGRISGVFARVRSFWRGLRRRAVVEAEMVEEFRLHVDLRAQDLVRSGLSPAEAKRRARREFGSPERYKEEARMSRGLRRIDAVRFFWLDVRYAVRSLRRKPWPVAMAVLSLGMGIGASTTMFGVIDALDFRPLPYRDADRLVWLTEVGSVRVPGCVGCPDYASAATASAWQSRLTSYEGLAVQSHFGVYLDDGGVSSGMDVGLASPGFFGLLGVQPLLGREFLPEDTIAGTPPVVLLSHETWLSRFNGSAAVIGTPFEYFDDPTLLERRPGTIVGVLPRGFRFWRDYPFWVAMGGDSQRSPAWPLTVVGRLEPGVARSTAEAELEVVHASLPVQRSNPDEERPTAAVLSLRERLRPHTAEGRGTLFSITVIVLFVAVLNVAGLLVARAAARHQEFTVRHALGASRARLIRQLLVEGVTLGLASGVLGATMAVWGVRVANTSLRLERDGLAAQVDTRVLAFSVALSIVVGLLTALLPARGIERTDLYSALRGPAGLSPREPRGRAPSVLLAAQISAGLILLTAAVLLSSEYLRIRYLGIGYDPVNLYEASIVGPSEYRERPERLRPEAIRARTRVGAIPGVASVSLRHHSAISPSIVRPEGRVGNAPADEYVPVVHVDHDYFATLGIRTAAGRTLAEGDVEGAPAVAVVNRSAAARFWPGRAVLGRRVFVGDSASVGEWLTVVGVVDDIERGELVRRGYPRLYRPLGQSPIYHPRIQMHLRVADRRPETLRAVQTAVREALGRPIRALTSHEAELGERFVAQRIHALALDLFAAVALLLAGLGVYASFAYAVTRRTREIAVRVALGASRGNVLMLFARHAVVIVFIGLTMGCVGSFALSRILQSFLSATSATDLRAFAGAVLLMTCAVFIATYVPARRAMAVEPTIALRSD